VTPLSFCCYCRISWSVARDFSGVCSKVRQRCHGMVNWCRQWRHHFNVEGRSAAAQVPSRQLNNILVLSASQYFKVKFHKFSREGLCRCPQT